MKNSFSRLLRFLVLIWFFLVTTSNVYAGASSSIRAVHIVIFNLSVGDAKKIINFASIANFNTVILGFPWNNGVKLDSTPWVVSNHLTWSRADLLDVSNFARQKGMDVIPQLPLLSHQTLLFSSISSDLLFNSQTYDPRNSGVYRIVFPLIDEVIDLLHPSAIHIGHDEVVGWKEKHFERGILKRDEVILPPELFLQDVTLINSYLKSKNVETWMWGDMLISPDEFPIMPNAGDINGSSLGYGEPLRRKIPDDIVICDWHYLGHQIHFPTLAAFKNDGFRVLGATWSDSETIVKFSKYAALHGADGMIATLWFHVQNKEWAIIEKIIRESGSEYGKNFPDVKQ